MKKGLIIILILAFLTTMAFVGCKTTAAEAAAAEAVAEEAAEEAVAEEAVEEAAAEEAVEEAAAETVTLGIAATSKDVKDMTVGFIPMGMANEFVVTLVEGGKKAAKELGLTLNVQSTTSFAQPEDQLQFVETMLSSNIDGIVLMAVDPKSMLSVTKRCQDGNIPLIAVDQLFDAKMLEEANLKVVPGIATENVTGGRVLGEWVKANFPKGTKIFLLRGVATSPTNIQRYDGFFEALGKDYLDVVAEQNCDWSIDLAYTATQNVLMSNPDIQLVFGFCDGMGIGALRAIEEANLADKIKIVGYNGDPEALDLVAEGKFAATIAQHPEVMGYLGVHYVVDLLQGKSVPVYTDSGIALVTNAAEVTAFREALKQ